MAKDDVDSFVTDVRTLPSILGHNEEIIAEKFKDVFPDKNIEAALIAMNNFGEMQTKAKQLVQIYCPNHTQDSSSLGACLMHTHEGTATSSKLKTEKPKVSYQHQLAPTQDNDGHKQSQHQTQNMGGYKGNNSGPRQGQTNDGYYRENNFWDSSRGSGRRGGRGRGHGPWTNNPNTDGQSSNQNSQCGRGGNQNRGRGRGYNPQQNQPQVYEHNYNPPQGQYSYMNQAPAPQHNSLPLPPPYDPNWQLQQTQFYNSPAVSGQYSTGQYSQGQYPPTQRANPHTGDHQNPRQSKQTQHICELCGNKGHCDYQCQFATDFMQQTQKAFQHSHYSHDVNTDQEWSQGEDHDDHQQPVQ